MTTHEAETIRQAVRETYAEIARSSAGGCGCGSSGSSCCGGEAESSIDAETAHSCASSGSSCCSGEAQSSSCCGGETTHNPADASSRRIGYSDEELASVPEGANMGLGCGNPQAIAALKPGETVLDLGSGGGLDCFLAGQQVGETGHVIGVDFTPDMISKARANAGKVEAENVEFRLGEIEHLPVADSSVDAILSNCVINLSPDKPAVYREAFRVLKPGGRLAIADVVAGAELPQEARDDLALHGSCVSGAAVIEDLKGLLADIGFSEVQIRTARESSEFIREWAPGSKIEDFVVSANIEAVRP